MSPNDSSMRRMGKNTDARNVAEKQIPEIIVGPKSSSDEIQVDGPEHLHTSRRIDNDKKFKNDSYIQDRPAIPYSLEYNNNIEAQVTNCFGADAMNETQEYSVGKDFII